MGRDSGAAGEFVMPVPGTHGLPKLVKYVSATLDNSSLRETPKYDAANSATHFIRPITTVALAPELITMLGSTLIVAPTAGPEGPSGFEAAVKEDLQSIYTTPTGKLLLDSLHASGRRIHINYGESNGAHFPYNNWPPAFYQEDGVTPGAGTTLGIEYNPFREEVGEGEKKWHKRPPGIGLAHELIHAEQAAYGRMRRGATVSFPSK